MTQDRRHLLGVMAQRGVPMGAGALSDLTRLPRTSARRAAEDLTMTGLLTRSGGDGGNPTWRLASDVRSWWQEKAVLPVGGTWRDETARPDDCDIVAAPDMLDDQEVADQGGRT